MQSREAGPFKKGGLFFVYTRPLEFTTAVQYAKKSGGVSVNQNISLTVICHITNISLTLIHIQQQQGVVDPCSDNCGSIPQS